MRRSGLFSVDELSFTMKDEILIYYFTKWTKLTKDYTKDLGQSRGVPLINDSLCTIPHRLSLFGGDSPLGVIQF